MDFFMVENDSKIEGAGLGADVVDDLDEVEMSEEDLAYLANHGTVQEKIWVARNPCTSLTTLADLCRSGFVMDVDENPMMPLHVEGGSEEVVGILADIALQTSKTNRLEELAMSAFDVVRSIVAKNQATPLDTIFSLAKDHSDEVRAAVCSNQKTPSTILSILAKDRSHNVRQAIAKNKNTSPLTLLMLCMDGPWSIQYEICQNESAPCGVLSMLMESEKEMEDFFQTRIAENEGTPSTLLAKLAQSQSMRVRRRVAENLNTAKEDLDLLSKDEMPAIRWGVAVNPNVPIEIVQRLAADRDGDVRRRVALATKDLRILKILSEDKEEYVRESALKSLSETEKTTP